MREGRREGGSEGGREGGREGARERERERERECVARDAREWAACAGLRDLRRGQYPTNRAVEQVCMLTSGAHARLRLRVCSAVYDRLCITCCVHALRVMYVICIQLMI